MILKHNW